MPNVNYQTECLVKFNTLPEFLRDAIGGEEASDIIGELENRYQISLDFPVVLISIGEMSLSDLPSYLNMRHQIKISDGEIIKNELAKNVFYIFDDIIPDDSESDFIDSEKISNVFKSGLIKMFNSDVSLIKEFNQGIFVNISLDDGIKQDELEKLLYINGEMLTHQSFEIDGKLQSPTIGNWIQDFIRYQGSGMFSNLALTKYITDSDNARRLPPEEKKLVQRLLQLYRNLKFFPESLADVPVEEWEIIPTNKEGLNKEPRKPIGLPKTEEEKKIEELKREEEEFSAGGLERLAIEEEIQGKKKLEDLKIEMNKYAAGSLERMVVEEEIRKLGN